MYRAQICRSILSLACLISWTITPNTSSSAPNLVGNVDRSLLTAARNLNQRGAEFLAAGKPDRALADWQQAEQLYTKINDVRGIIGTKINQAQALQSLGFYRQSLLVLQAVNAELQHQPDSDLKLSGLLGLGNSLRALRILDRQHSSSTASTILGAEETLIQALKIAQKLSDRAAIDRVNLSLGNTLGLMGKERAAEAIAAYRTIASTAEPLVRVQAQLNLYRLESVRIQKTNQLEFAVEVSQILATIAPSRSTIYAYINLAETIATSSKLTPQSRQTIIHSAKLLAIAIRQARTIQDPRGEAQAIGTLGNLYRSTGQLQSAKKLTQQALIIAESLPAPDLAYKLDWQLGRIIAADRPNARELRTAISLYSQAIKHLKSLRNDLKAIDADLQFSFRDSVEPVYREYVNLLLADGREISQADLATARDSIEALQVAELENFLRQDCLDTHTISLDKIDRSAAVIYPIILPDRVVTIASIPGRPLLYHSRKISTPALEQTISELRLKIQEPNFNSQLESALKQQSRQLYNLLLAPLIADLDRAKIKTLAFVLDGAFRNIPMSILSDGKKYLVENYRLALTPGLQLVPPQTITTRSRVALLGGISESRQGLTPLTGVKSELERIGRFVPNQTLLNERFNDRSVADSLVASNAPIVHFATHGQFSSSAEDTFILTWDNRLNLDRLSTLLQNRGNRANSPIDLLVLSACDTALGDNRATLGLAGIAIRARANSTLASLWSVSDEATQDLMISFYQNLLTKNLSKGTSLQLAQQALLRNPKYRAPYYWAPFVLVGNWQ
jgi:CHAT domain-containing protein